jgi:hypothetical protein
MRENSVPGWGALLLCALTADFFKNWDAISLQIPNLDSFLFMPQNRMTA